MPHSTRLTHFDVCVLGGGPAGTSTAIRLAQLGHTVCLVEKARFPRAHVGESLSPGVWTALRILGLAESHFESCSLRVRRASMRWSEPRTDSIAFIRPDQGFTVDRGRFDSLLLEAAIAAGVIVFEATRIVSTERLMSGWRLESDGDGGTCPIAADFLIDAAGRKGFFPGERTRLSEPTLAVCGYVQSDWDSGETRIEAIPRGWCWGAPVPGGIISAMVFLDRDLFRQMRSLGIERLWRSSLSDAELFRRISTAPQMGRLVVCDASMYSSTDAIGNRFIRAGEALFSLDPLSSTGVERAMHNGITAGTVVHTIIHRPERYELCAAYYCDRQAECTTQHVSWTSAFYGEVRRFAECDFWKARSVSKASESIAPSVSFQHPPTEGADRMKVHVSKATRLIQTACQAGDEIEPCFALSHPSLDRPVAFLGGIRVTPLLEAVQQCGNLESLLISWSNQIPRESVLSTAAWFLSKGILELRGMSS